VQKKKLKVIFYSILSDFPNGIAFGTFQASHVCPFGNSNILTQVSTEHWWN